MSYPTPVKALTPNQLAEVTQATLTHIRRIKPSKYAWDEGMTWYAKANQFCQDLAEILGLPWQRVTWALAALSPLNNWRQNKIDLVDLATTGHCGSLPLCRHKALRLLDGEPYEDVVRGQKVTAFGHNLTWPTQSRLVTIDSHMQRVLEMPERYLERAGVYQAVGEAFQRSARGRGILPHQLQAALWIEVRGTHD